MKKNLLVPISILLILTLGCRITIDMAPATEEAKSIVDTAVAETIAAHIVAATATVTPSSTSTSTPTMTVTPSATATATARYCGWHCPPWHHGDDDAEFIAHVTFPNGTFVTPGTNFLKTWQVLNTGGETWYSSYDLVFIGGDSLSGSTTSIGQTVYPGETANVSVWLKAPAAEGSYAGYWQLADEHGNTFGDSLPVQIIVASPVITAPPSATITATRGSVTPKVPATREATEPPATVTPTPVPSGGAQNSGFDPRSRLFGFLRALVQYVHMLIGT